MGGSFRGVRHFRGGSLLNSTTILFDKYLYKRHPIVFECINMRRILMLDNLENIYCN